MNELTITNYDNFKDLSFFVDEHEKAMKILENVNNFYLSFLKSKLLYCRDIDKYPGNILKQSFISEINLWWDLKRDAKQTFFVKEGRREIYGLLKYHIHNNSLDNMNESVVIGFYDSWYAVTYLKGIIKSAKHVPGFFPGEKGRYDIKLELDEPIPKYDFIIESKNPYNTHSLCYNVLDQFGHSNMNRQQKMHEIYNNPILQTKFKEELSKILKKNNHDYWLYFNSFNNTITEFDTNKNLNKYQFKIIYNLHPQKIIDQNWNFDTSLDITSVDKSLLHKYLIVYRIEPYTVEVWPKEIRKSKNIYIGGSPFGGAHFASPKKVKKYELIAHLFDVDNGNYFTKFHQYDASNIISNLKLNNI